MKRLFEVIGAIIFAIALIFLSGLLTGLIVMLLWNWLLPTIFGLSTITYWQGWGLSVLCGLLFKSASSKSNN